MRGPIISAIAATSTLYVSGSTSTKAGVSPARTSGREVGRKGDCRGDDLVARVQVE